MTRAGIALAAMLVFAPLAGAETVYVSSDQQFGLHADKTIESPIVKLIPSGEALELIKTEDQSSYVRTTDGTGGWIDNSYLSRVAPASGGPVPAAAASAGQAASPDTAGQMAELEQQLKSERVKTGELQVQLAELRKRLGQDGSNDALYQKIDQLAMEKKELEVQLARILEGEGLPSALPPATDANGLSTPRNMLIAAVVALIAGVIAGLYLMDVLYRRRHGGFRV